MALLTCRNCGCDAFEHEVEAPFPPRLGEAGQILAIGRYTTCPTGRSRYEPETFHLLIDLIGWQAVNEGRTPEGEKKTLLRKLDVALGYG